MITSPCIYSGHHRHQSGAALVVALILLVALSLMAISSMNTATLDLIMAGNEQYRSRAFAAAETGIQRAIAGGTFNSGSDYSASSSAGSDTYAYSITRPNAGAVEKPPSGYSEGEGQFGTIYFRIASTGSTGTSARDSRAINTQEVYEVVKASGTAACDSSGGASCDLGGP